MPRDEASLLDIAQAARLILVFKEGMDKAAFLQDFKTQSAILHQLLVMGEAVNDYHRVFATIMSKFPGHQLPA